MDALSAAWQGDELPPNLAQFFPAEPPLRRLVLIELIKVDLEYRWQHHELPKQVEEYVEEFPELASAGEVPCDLIYEEFHIRRQTERSAAAGRIFRSLSRAGGTAAANDESSEPKQMASTTLCGAAARPSRTSMSASRSTISICW